MRTKEQWRKTRPTNSLSWRLITMTDSSILKLNWTHDELPFSCSFSQSVSLSGVNDHHKVISSSRWAPVSVAPPSAWSFLCSVHVPNLCPGTVQHVSSREQGGFSSGLQRISESYWRDTWRHLSSGRFPGCCCYCCVCASCWSSGTVCTSAPERIRRTGETFEMIKAWRVSELFSLTS